MFYNLDVELKKQRISKKELTNMLNQRGVDITYPTVCRWIRGDTEPTFEQAGIISKILGKEMGYLFEKEI